MSKLLKRLNDNQNKVADTNGIMKLQAWDDGVAQDLTNKKITATVANASGFLFDLDLVSNGTEIDLDFKDSQLQKLTPDTYFLEVKVTDEAGDVSVFPTEGYAIFTINKNLHATEGALVPQITFDTVLADVKTAMDEKVAEYVKTIAKGDKGDTPDLSNYVTVTDLNNGLSTKVTDNKNGKISVNGTSIIPANENVIGRIDWEYKDMNDIPMGWMYLNGWADLSNLANLGLPNDFYFVHCFKTDQFVSTTIQIAYGLNNYVYTRTKNGSNWSTWKLLADDSKVAHKTGNEVLAGDKTFTSNTTLATTTILAGNYGLRVTPSGFQKTTDGKTWVSANI